MGKLVESVKVVLGKPGMKSSELLEEINQALTRQK
jgi:hypothetical protein